MSEFSYEEKGKATPKRGREQPLPQKVERRQPDSSPSERLDAGGLRQMQQTLGNAAVQRFLAQRSAEGAAEIENETAQTIEERRGSGHALDDEVAAQAGGVMNHDFGDVRVHTDDPADRLNHDLSAEAFTTGHDIFFRKGAYSPGSREGQRLIAHELTHVVQQGASPPSVQSKMTVNDPDDEYEAEADAVADMVVNQSELPTPQRQAVEEEERLAEMQEIEEEPEDEALLQMQEMDEDEAFYAERDR